MKTSSLACIVLVSLALITQVQARKTADISGKQSFPVSISITNQSWAMPFTKILRLSPFHPGLHLGTEIYYRNRDRSQLFQTVNLGGFINNSSGSAFFLHSDFGYRRITNSGIRADISLGMGYFQGYYTRPAYQMASDGGYEKLNKRGIASSLSNLNIGLGYDFSKISERHITPFIRYQWMTSTPYWSLLGIRPNGIFHIGIQLKPFHKIKSNENL